MHSRGQSPFHPSHRPKMNNTFAASSSSLSSLSSSAASDMLLPAAPPSNSSQSDVSPADAPQPSSPPAHNFIPHSSPSRSSPAPSQPAMGLVLSRPENTRSQPAGSSGAIPACASGSSTFKLKSAFGARRKRADVPVNNPSSPRKSNPSRDVSLNNGATNAPGTPQRQHLAKQLTLSLASHVFNRKGSSSTAGTPTPTPMSPVPPPVPPKSSPPPRPAINSAVDKRTSIMPTSPSMAPALDFMRRVDSNDERPESKEGKRKSDSTISHHTIRPGFTMGNRSSRPVSMAESLHSTHTVQPSNKRLSAFMTDEENTMVEEEDSERPVEMTRASTLQASSASSLFTPRNRRSQSVSFGPTRGLLTPEPTPIPTSASLEAFSNLSTEPVRIPRQQPVTVVSPEARFTGFLPSTSLSSVHSQLRPLPQLHHASRSSASQMDVHNSFRNTAISVTSSFAPAAGLARRAVEKMGRVWGSRTSSSSSSGRISPAGSGPSAFAPFKSHSASRNSLSASESTHNSRRSKHHPQSSASWSISSHGSSSISDQDGFITSSSMSLGKRLRGPYRMSQGGAGVAGGLVFGRDLRLCVRQTAIDSVRSALEQAEQSGTPYEGKNIAVLEERLLPAIVVRCAQHLMTWGVQELGLFRVSGRPTHISKLRSEFDTGADFELAECGPGDLDPHAVASVFKAYLRELPEPILTHGLSPYFEAAMVSDRNNQADSSSQAPEHVRSRSQPAFAGLRKPPSLSTLAVPAFAGSQPPSDYLRRVLSNLVSRLPAENRDLLRTVIELINETARRKQETKMPMSNLLLVLCPSLNMNPTLLQALCESEGIWEGGIHSEEAEPATNAPQRTEVNETVVPKTIPKIRPLPPIPHRDPQNPPETLYLDCVSDDQPSVSLASAATTSHSEAATPDETSPRTSNDDSVSSSSRLSTPGLEYGPLNLHSAPSLSSSADTLSTPSMLSASPQHNSKLLPLGDEPSGDDNDLNQPVVPTDIPPPISSPQSEVPSFAHVEFPSSDDTLTRPGLAHQRSHPSLSVTIPSPRQVSRSNSFVSKALLRKPSLHLLFTKMSMSNSEAASESPAPESTRSSMMLSPTRRSRIYSPATSGSSSSLFTAPQSITSTAPPMLNTAIDSSSISLALGIEDDESTDQPGESPTQDSPLAKPATRKWVSEVSPQDANACHARSTCDYSPHSPSRHSIASTAYLDFNIREHDFGDEEDWTRSVLMAAGANS